MKIKISLKDVKLSVENKSGDKVLDVAYDNYDATIDLTKGAESVAELVQSFGEVAAQIEAASKITH